MRLRDLQAPPWSVTVGSQKFGMRPLSLATFAEAELIGLDLGRLSDPKDTRAWIELFAFLTGLDATDELQLTEEVLPALLTDPVGFEAFRVRVAESFSGEDAVKPKEETPAPKSKGPRKVQKFKAATPEETAKDIKEKVDYGFLLDVARTSTIAVRDLMQMTFYGVTCVSKSLERLPPMPGLTGALG